VTSGPPGGEASEPRRVSTHGGSRCRSGIAAASTYRREWLSRDVLAGLVLAVSSSPGDGYAELAGLPPITGLYTSILCLIGYGLFGPSRILVLGPDSCSAR
jgi:MFS superfamily sulfate permease-like transporter